MVDFAVHNRPLPKVSPMLKKKELQTKVVAVDGVDYTCSAMTVHKRTLFESAIVNNGQEYMRELLLVFCVTITETGLPLFPRDTYLDKDAKDQDEAEKAALTQLINEIADYPGTQLELLVTTCMEVNGLLGNGSPQS